LTGEPGVIRGILDILSKVLYFFGLML